MKNKENLIIKGYKVKLYPTTNQEKTLNRWVSSTRWLWNSLLGLEMKTYNEKKIFLWQKELNEIVNRLKKDPGMEWLCDLPAHATQFVINNLCSALKSSSKKTKNRKGFPKFKKKRWGTGTVYMVNISMSFFEEPHKIKLPKLDLIKYRGDNLFEGRLVCSKIIKDGNDWFLSSQFECPKPEIIPPILNKISIDLGINRFATIYDGTSFIHIDAPKNLQKYERRMGRIQRKFSRRKKGSGRRRIQQQKLYSLHKKITSKRIDFLHKLSSMLITKANEICVENLNIKGMLKNHHLAKSIADASMGEFLRQLMYKSDWHSRKLTRRDRWFASSQLCSRCGTQHPEMKSLGKRVLVCGCGNLMDRDDNSTVNLWYGEEPRNRPNGTTDVEIGDHEKVIELSQAPVYEASILNPLLCQRYNSV